MNDYLLEAREELKRLEHIIYVSLKYTRTVDVIINALRRMVGTIDYIIEAFLEKAKEENKISSLPKSPALRATHLSQLFKEDKILQRYLTFYTFLKTILNGEHARREEYRRHVTMIIEMPYSTAEIKIDNLVNAEKFLHGFLDYARREVDGFTDDDDDF
jgi:hypothetical protein